MKIVFGAQKTERDHPWTQEGFWHYKDIDWSGFYDFLNYNPGYTWSRLYSCLHIDRLISELYSVLYNSENKTQFNRNIQSFINNHWHELYWIKLWKDLA